MTSSPSHLSAFTPWARLEASKTSGAAPVAEVRTVLVIGAGSSGLVAAKYLVEAGYEVTIVEKGPCIGGTFVSKAYDEGGLVSSKYLTAFTDLRSPDSDPSHLSMKAYVEYLKKYAREFNLYKLITFGARVMSVERRENGVGYTVRLEPVTSEGKAAVAKATASLAQSPQHGAGSPARADQGAYPVHVGEEASTRMHAASTRTFDAVCVCSGLHEVPYVPPLSGLDTFSGVEVLHSSEYKDRYATFAGKRVLIIGCGETGMDLAYRAVQVSDATAISMKTGNLCVPHEGWGGVPLDTLMANLFEHSYEHWWCHKHHLKWRFTTVFIKFGFFVMGGSSAGYNQWAGRVPHVKRGYNILCKSTAALPYINRPLKRAARWYSWLWDWNEKKVDKDILSFPAPTSVNGKTVTFKDGRTFDTDVIVFATGYRQTFPFLHKAKKAEMAAADAASAEVATLMEAEATSGWRAGTGARGPEDPLPAEHFVISPDEPTLSFLGFVRPNVGAIPPMAEMQVMWWIQRLKGKTTPAVDPPSYGLLGKKLLYGVDYGNYMHQLAAEIGAAPSVFALAKRPRVLIAYCIGQAYVVFFRLQGPYASPKAWDIAANELFQPVVRRGFFANATLIGTMALFGFINLWLFAIESCLHFALQAAHGLGLDPVLRTSGRLLRAASSVLSSCTSCTGC